MVDCSFAVSVVYLIRFEEHLDTSTQLEDGEVDDASVYPKLLRIFWALHRILGLE